MIAPAIVLVRPQLGENIGAAARVMANFGLRDLRLVAPRDGWPNPDAASMAGRALDILDAATLHHSVADAIADCVQVLATTARERAMALPVYTPAQAARHLQPQAAANQRTALLFGPERTGLENEDLASVDGVLTIPVAPQYTSLNLAQAVAVCAYEWWQAATAETGPAPQPESRASKAEMEGLFAQLEAALDTANFWNVPEKKAIMWRNIRQTLTRAALSPQETATWRGILRALERGGRRQGHELS